MAATIVFAALLLMGLLLLVFLVLPHRLVRACAATYTGGGAGRCLTTDQRLQAEASVRSAGVQALGGAAVLLGAGGGLIFTWRQVQLGRNQLLVSLESNKDQFRIARDQLAASQEQLLKNLDTTRQLAIDARNQELAQWRRQTLLPTLVKFLGAGDKVFETSESMADVDFSAMNPQYQEEVRQAHRKALEQLKWSNAEVDLIAVPAVTEAADALRKALLGIALAISVIETGEWRPVDARFFETARLRRERFVEAARTTVGIPDTR